MSVATERIVYEESVRTVAQQRDLLDGLRARAGTLLAAASVSTAFLSAPALARHQAVDVVQGRAITHPTLTDLGWVAVALFCGVVLYRNLSYWNGAHYDANGLKLDLMLGLFGLACLLLLAEIVIWLLVLSGT